MKVRKLDAGASPNRRFDRAADELVGLCRGLLADGEVNTQEAIFLQDWILRNAAFADRYPFDAIFRRLSTALSDGVLDAEESSDLLGTLAAFVGGEAFDAKEQITSLASELPFCRPVPTISYLPDHYFEMPCFVVTGTFTYGGRQEVMRAILERGGQVASSVLRRTRYLIVGELASRDWMHSNYGRKIEQAVQLREQGQQISIIGERDWVAQL